MTNITQAQAIVAGYVQYMLDNNYHHGGMSHEQAKRYCEVAEHWEALHLLSEWIYSDCYWLLNSPFL